MMTATNVLTFIISTAILFMFTWLLQRKYAISTEEKAVSESYVRNKKLKKVFQRIEVISGLLGTVAMLPVGYLFFELLNCLHKQQIPPEVQLIFSVENYWAMIIASIASAAFAVMMLSSLFAKIILGRFYKGFMAYQNLKFNMNTARAGNVFHIIIGLPAVLFYLFVSHWFFYITDSQISYGKFFSFQKKTYHYSDIQQIKRINTVEAPVGKVHENVHFIIEFNDGNSWSTLNNGFSNHSTNKLMIDYLIQTTGLQLTQLEKNN